MIGDTGVGKSSLGNLFLNNKNAFKASDSPIPVTLEVSEKSQVFNDFKKWAIDTEGLEDGNKKSSQQIKNLANFLRNCKRGIEMVAIVLNGRSPRFSQGVKDIIHFVYNAFATEKLLSHLCLVFTNCENPSKPNRTTIRSEYMKLVKDYLNEITGNKLDKDLVIPCYFVDCDTDGTNQETKENMENLDSLLLLKDPLSTKDIIEAGYRETHEIETRNHYFIKSETRGDTTYEIFENQKRTKIIPNNNDPPRYTNWETLKRMEEAVLKVITERRNNVDLGYRYSDDRIIRYHVTVDQERKVTKDLRANTQKCTGWYNISDERFKEAGRLTVNYETRQGYYDTQTREHHSGHGLFGGRSHTHVHVFRHYYTQKRTVTTDYDGKIDYSEWLTVPGSESSNEINSWEE